MDEPLVTSRVTQREYKPSEMQRITNVKQIALYLKNGIKLYDLFCGSTIDATTKEEKPTLVAYFKKADTRWAYDLWQKKELK